MGMNTTQATSAWPPRPHFPSHNTVPAIAHHWMPQFGGNPPNASR